MDHINHRVCTVMLSKTAHQLVHSDPNFVIPPSMCFGNWPEFLRLYHTGITRDICFKLIYYIKKVVDKKEESLENTTKLLQLRNDIVNWSEWNERGILTVN